MSYDVAKVFTISWKIVNYSFINLKYGSSIESPVCYIEHMQGTKWFLRLYPNGCNPTSQGNISLFLNRHNSNDNLPISCALELIDPHGNIMNSFKFTDTFTPKRHCIGKIEFLSIEKLREFMKSSNWKEDMLWIRCHVFDHTFKLQATLCKVRTEIKEQRCLWRWNIRLSDCCNKSKIIKVPFLTETEFEITLAAVEGEIIITVKNSEKLVLGKLYKLELSILDHKGVKINFEDNTFLLQSTEENEFLKFDGFVKEYNVNNGLGLLKLKSFTLMCCIYSPNGERTSIVEFDSLDSSPREISQAAEVPCLSLQEDLKNMLMNEKHCDVKLRIDSEIIPAHKSLLCARSPVFSTMFDQEMLENETGIVDISDIEIGTMRTFLEFLYTDNLPKADHDHVLKLLLVADKYQVNMLKEHCSDILVSKLSIENVCEVISVAELISHSKLKSSALEYIKINKKNILSTTEWSDWVEKNMKLAVEILSKLLVD